MGNEFEFQKYWISFQEMSRFYFFFYFPKGHSLAYGKIYLHSRYSMTTEEWGKSCSARGSLGCRVLNHLFFMKVPT